MKTRWIANIIFVVAILGSLLVIYELGNISGRVVNVIPTSGQCTETYYEALWESMFRIEYVGDDVDIGFKTGIIPTGNCVDFDLYKDTKLTGSHLVYFINHNSTRKPGYLAGIFTVNDPNNNWIINDTYQLRNKFYETLYGVKNRAVNVDGIAGAVTIVTANFKQDVSNTPKWDSSASDYHVYREVETTKQDNSFLTRNVSIAVYKQKEALLYYYDSEVTTPVLDFIINISNVNNVEDNNSVNVFDLDDHFAGNVFVDYNLTTNDVANITVDSQKRATLNFKKDWSGIISVSVYGYYKGMFLNLSNNFTINLIPTNDRPMLKDNYPTVVSWRKNNQETIYFDDFFYDPDGDVLKVNISGNDKIDAEVDDSEREIDLEPDMDFVGIETVKLKATDPGGLSVETGNIKLNVTGSSSGTASTTISSIQILSKSPVASIVNINVGGSGAFLVDATGSNTLTYTWTVNGIDQGNEGNSFAFTGNNPGSYAVKVDISDGVHTTSASWSVVVTQTNVVTSSTTSTTLPYDDGGGIIDDLPIVEEPKFLWIYIIIGVGSVLVIGAAVFFMLRSMKKRPKEQEYETVRSDEELGKVQEFGIVKNLDPRLNDVINFIKEYRSKGFGDETIRNALLRKGWGNNDIDEAFRNC